MELTTWQAWWLYCSLLKQFSLILISQAKSLALAHQAELLQGWEKGKASCGSCAWPVWNQLGVLVRCAVDKQLLQPAWMWSATSCLYWSPFSLYFPPLTGGIQVIIGRRKSPLVTDPIPCSLSTHGASCKYLTSECSWRRDLCYKTRNWKSE